MDHYRVLGVSRNATKEEIKQAFRNLAMKFHPDKHAHSSDHLRESSTHKFKQLSEAYETLVDDRKRADYNIRQSSSNFYRNSSNPYYNYYTNNTGSRYSNYHGSRSGYGYGFSGPDYGGGSGNRTTLFTKFEILLRFMTTRTFLLNAAFAGVVLGAVYIIDEAGQALWKLQNSGKSFEEAMESIEKVKATKDET